jgi:ATP-dependent DNA helicase RecQ
MMFLPCLHSAVNKSALYSKINIKPKQAKCLEALFNRRDTVAVLPTGYGKSLIYQLLPSLLHERNLFEQRQSGEAVLNRNTPVILVVSPLNSLVDNQLRKLNKSTGLKAAILKNTQEELLMFK